MAARRWTVIFCLGLTGCVQSFPPPVECGDKNDCYIQHTLDTLKAIALQIDYWDNVTLAAALMAGFAGVVATIMIALQGDENRYWTRPTGIIATALVTGITALVTSFHIPESKDKYIAAYGQLVELNNKFEHNIRSAKDDEADTLRFQYSSDFTKIKADLLKVKGSLSLVSTNPPVAQQPSQAPK
jgi:hypothetical protein